MSGTCLVCNTSVVTHRKSVNVFDDNENRLQSNRKTYEVLNELIGKSLDENLVHSQIICRKCYISVSEYDAIKDRLKDIKSTFLKRFKETLPLHNLDYDTYGKTESPKTICKKIVVPASKLQPVPDSYVFDLSKIAGMARARRPTDIKKLVIPVPKVATETKPSQMPKLVIGTLPVKSPLKVPASTPDSMKKTKNPLLSFTANSEPKEFVSSVEDDNQEDPEKCDSNSQSKNDGEQEMEIDEECTMAVITPKDSSTVSDTEKEQEKTADSKVRSNFFDVGLLLSPDDGEAPQSDKDGKYILDKVQILKHDEDDEEGTIVMENCNNTTIIRMATGQRVLYDGKEISLVHNENGELQDSMDGDSQDSNDDTQIELQVSGDEETAKAIIAAAQESGGAIIKVESGEMFRVETICQSQDSDVDEGDSHIHNLVQRDGVKFKCLLCEKNPNNDGVSLLADADSAMKHLRTSHGARAYICPVCPKVLRRRAEYFQHLEQHSNKGKTILNKGKQHQCTLCHKRYNSKVLLSDHMYQHTGDRPYSCNVCSKTFASKYTHQAHLKTHSSRPRPFKCTQCGKTFLTQQNLTQHEKTHTGIKEFVCNICDKAFATQHNLEIHGVIHTGHKPFPCSVCGKRFARRAEIQDHMRVHTGERPFACDICGATFSQRSNLHSHKRATHLDDKRHACPHCPKRFKRKRLVDYHIKSAHTGERPLQCEVCCATFVYPEHYKNHARIHSGERPFDCEVCGKSFNSRDNRNTHRFVHSDKKPYECLTCGTGYMRKQLLYAHMNNTGHIAESIVVNQPRVIKAFEDENAAQLVDVQAIQIQANNISDTIFGTTQQLELDTTNISTIESQINLVQDGEDQTFLTLHNLTGLIGTSAEKLDDQAQIINTDDPSSGMRLIQVQLPDGRAGYVALDRPL